MSRAVNTVLLVGNLTRDPELRKTPDGQDVVNFSIALNRSYKDAKDEWQEATDYVDITAWDSLALHVDSKFKSGSKVLVSGRLQSRSYEYEGKKRSKVDVLAQYVTPIITDKEV